MPEHIPPTPWRRLPQNSGPDIVAEYAQLRADCEAAGHALAQKGHTADRWIAATAIRLETSARLERRDLPRRAGPTARNAPVRLNEPNPGFRMYPVGTRGRVCRVMAPLWANLKVPLCRTFKRWS